MPNAPMDPPDPDAAKMIAFQQGDVAAFEQLLDKHYKAIVNFIYKFVNNREESEELTQEVFLKVFRARATYEPRARFKAWLYRIATNVSLKASEKKRRFSFRRSFEERDFELYGYDGPVSVFAGDAERNLLEKESAEMVRRALRELPKNEKVAIILRRYEGLSYKEIAEVMNCTEGAVKTYIHRGKLRLRDLLYPYIK